MTDAAQRPYRPELREPRVFPVPGFDAEPLDDVRLGKHKAALDKRELLAAMTDGRPVVRANCLRALALLAPLDAAEAQQVAVVLRDADPAVRVAAAKALGHTADPTQAAVPLAEACADADAAVVAQARASLDRLGDGTLPALVAQLTRKRDWVEARLAPAVAARGAAAVAALLPALQGEDPNARDNALLCLEFFDDEATLRAVLASIAERKEPVFDLVRTQMQHALHRMARRGRPAHKEPTVFAVPGFDDDLLAPDVIAKNLAQLPRPGMLLALQDGRVAVRVNALQALEAHGPLGEGEVPAVAVLLRDSSASVRATAARCLRRTPRPELAVPALIAAGADRDAQVRKAVGETLASLGPAALPAMMQGLKLQPAVADVALLPHLAAYGDKAQPLLVQALTDRDGNVRGNALAGLILLGHEALQASSRQVSERLQDPDGAVRALARQALGIVARATRPFLHEPAPLPHDDFAAQLVDEAELKKAAKKLSGAALLALTRDGRTVVRANAWRGLAALGPLDHDGALQAAVACKDGEAEVRREAAAALRQCPETALATVVPALAAMSRDADPSAVQAARKVVFSHGKKAVPHLVALFNARDANLQSQAIRLLAALEADAAPEVLAALESGLPMVRENALATLSDMGGKVLDDACDRVTERLGDPHDGARLQAVLAIARMKPAAWKKRADLGDRLRKLWQADASLAVRNAAGATWTRISQAT